MTKYIWFTVILIAVLLALAYKQAPKEPEVSRPEPPAPQNVISDVPQPEEGEPVVSASGNVKVTRPQPDAMVASPLLVKGSAKLAGASVQLRLKDASGAVIAEKQATVAEASEDGFGSFGELLVFDAVPEGAGILEVYAEGVFDRSEQDLISIPIKF
ncbi:MAG: Gmad2 immunoglobulin-like domain-containing protein [Patescibacteria group bacterium]